jgi:hypothetical protein
VGSAPTTGPPSDDGVPLTPDELVDYLWQRHRLKRSTRTLQLYRREGGGPPFHRHSNSVLYLPRLADQWAIECRGDPIRNNSEQAARRLMADAKGEDSAA